MSEAESRSGERARDGVSSADYGKTASFLAIGVGLTGVITYVYFFIASHVLSKPDYGQITVLWSAVFITISTLYRPIEQLLSRHISEHLVKREPIGGTMRIAATIQLGLGLTFAVLALALRGPLQNDMLDGNETLYWVFFSAVLFYAASYFARGFLAGGRRFGLFTALILSESVFRSLPSFRSWWSRPLSCIERNDGRTPSAPAWRDTKQRKRRAPRPRTTTSRSATAPASPPRCS